MAKDNPLVDASEALQGPPVSSPGALCPMCLEVSCECVSVLEGAEQCGFVGYEYDFSWRCKDPVWKHGVCKWHFLEEGHDRHDCTVRGCPEKMNVLRAESCALSNCVEPRWRVGSRYCRHHGALDQALEDEGRIRSQS